MSQFPHDEFVKEYLPELYQEYGIVTPSADVMRKKREVDLLFIPTKPVPTSPDTLGLLGKLAQTTCLLEVYRNAVNKNTLWLRILGKGNTQLEAIEELKALPPNNPHREIILELIYGLLDKRF